MELDNKNSYLPYVHIKKINPPNQKEGNKKPRP